MPPKWGISQDRAQDLLSCGGGQDTLACQISDYSSHAFSRKYGEIPNLNCFKMRKVVKQTGGQNLISCEGGQDTLACKFQAIRPMRSQENVRNLQIWTASLCKKNPQILVKSTNRDENLNRCSGYISIPNFMPLPPGFSRKCPKTLKLARFTKFFGLCDLENWHVTLKIRAPQATIIW